MLSTSIASSKLFSSLFFKCALGVLVTRNCHCAFKLLYLDVCKTTSIEPYCMRDRLNSIYFSSIEIHSCSRLVNYCLLQKNEIILFIASGSTKMDIVP